MKVAFITGPARGIGEGIARALAKRGYAVALVGLEIDRLRALAQEINDASAAASGAGGPGAGGSGAGGSGAGGSGAGAGAGGSAAGASAAGASGAGGSGTGRSAARAGAAGERAIACEADVTDSAALERAVKQTLTKWAHINVVVANAGIANNGSFATTHVEDLVRVVNVNLNGVIRTMKAAYDALAESRGYALLISSASAFPALPGITAYGASKAGVDHLSNNLRLEMQALGVDVGVAYPSWIDTDLVRDQYEELPYFKKALDSKMLGQVTSLDECVEILVEGIEQRKRRIYIPEHIGFLHAFRSLAVSRLWDLAITFASNKVLPSMNEDARELGRSFGKHSVEAQRKK